MDWLSQQHVTALWPDVAGAAAAHTDIVAFRGGVITVYADSPVWANSIMHQRQGLAEALRRQGARVRELRVRVRAKPAPDTVPAERNPTRLPASAAKLLREVAADVESDSLRESLLRLSRRSDRNQS